MRFYNEEYYYVCALKKKLTVKLYHVNTSLVEQQRKKNENKLF